jgi:medium-chain acyl-[acyl-carrier-protein] hydrolase
MSSTEMRSAWLLRLQPNPHARLRLFCFPCAGKGASLFRTWPPALPEWIELLGVQYPGREQRRREESFTHMPHLVEAVAEGLRPYVDRPYAVFGHSFGALAGFELVRQLRREGCPEPEHLFVAARRAPHLGPRHTPIADLPQPEFLAAVQRRYDGIPAEILRTPEVLDLLLPALRADIRLLEAYAYVDGPPLQCRMTCLGGSSDPEIGAQDLEEWRRHTTGLFAVRMFPGGHFFLHSAQDALLPQMISVLKEALTRTTPAREA